jgi:hypothetical protein
MTRLLDIPPDMRDENWNQKFLQEFQNGQVKVLEPQPQPGPDGWPYLMVAYPTSQGESVHPILHWLMERGIGLVINPHEAGADYLMSYGSVWSLIQFKNIAGTATKSIHDSHATGLKLELQKGQRLHSGPPSEEYLPAVVRKVIRQFLFDQGIIHPKILVLSENKVDYDLAFSLESLGRPPENEHAGIAEALAWFLPPDYRVVLIAEAGLPPFGAL